MWSLFLWRLGSCPQDIKTMLSSRKKFLETFEEDSNVHIASCSLIWCLIIMQGCIKCQNREFRCLDLEMCYKHSANYLEIDHFWFRFPSTPPFLQICVHSIRSKVVTDWDQITMLQCNTTRNHVKPIVFTTSFPGYSLCPHLSDVPWSRTMTYYPDLG